MKVSEAIRAQAVRFGQETAAAIFKSQGNPRTIEMTPGDVANILEISLCKLIEMSEEPIVVKEEV